MANAPGPDDLEQVRSDLGRAFALIDAKHDDYVTAREMYDGTRQEVAASRAIKRLIERNDGDKHTLSIAHVPVDALFDRVELQGVTSEDETANAALNAVQDANDLEDEYDDWHRKAGYFGDYYAIVDPSTIETLDGGQQRAVLTDIEVVGKSPLDTIMVYDAKTGRNALYGVTRWVDGDGWHAILFYDDVSVFLTAEKSDSAPKPDAWDYEVDPGDGDQLDPDALIDTARPAHPGGRKLIVHYAIDSKPYGTPVHKKAYGPQESITKINAINLVNVDGQGLGARWALEDPAKEIDDDLDQDFGTDGPDTRTTGSGDGQSQVAKKGVRNVPGEIALLKGIKSVGQFDAADSDQFTGNLEWYIRITAVITGTPMFEFDMKGEQPSGESRRRAESRINKHARKVQRALGRAHEQLADVTLGLLGIDAPVTATFLPVETSTDKEGFELIGTKIATGVPIAQSFREAGYTDEQVEEWFPKGEPNVNYDTLVKLASALQQLGQAKTLGVISEQDIRRLAPLIITAAVDEGVVQEAPTAAVAVPPELAAS